jgi:hypothetical protein
MFTVLEADWAVATVTARGVALLGRQAILFLLVLLAVLEKLLTAHLG